MDSKDEEIMELSSQIAVLDEKHARTTKELEMISAENAKLGSVFRDDMANQNDERINEY